MACSTGCLTKNHASYGECMRDKSTRVAYCDSVNFRDYTAEKQKDADLAAYKAAREQGIQPKTSQRRDVDDAVILSDVTGKAFQA